MTAIFDAAGKAPKAPTAHELLQAALDAGDGEEEGSGGGDALASAAAAGRVWLPPSLRRSVRDALRPKEDLPLPEGIRATLRPYQRVGYSWLASLTAIPCGAILADDMGLGKTLQTLCLIQHLKESGRLAAPGGAAGTRGGPAVVICPATLLSNWASEAGKFAPGLRVYVHHGAAREDIQSVAGGRAGGPAPKRQRKDAAGGSGSGSGGGGDDGQPSAQPIDLVLTSYGTLRAETDAFKRCHFSLVIIDEAQIIKNASAGITKARRRQGSAALRLQR